MRCLALVLTLSLVWTPVSAEPQQRTGSPNAPSALPPQLDEIPISVKRVRKQLALAPRSTGSGLRLEYYVEVYGKSIPIDVFADFDLQNGPVPFGGPTHQEFLNLVTPEEFRSPPADLLTPALALFKWLGKEAKKKREQTPPR